jgi:signal transduction histidine kinase
MAVGVGVCAAFFLEPFWSPMVVVVGALAMGSALAWRHPRPCLALGLTANVAAALSWGDGLGDADRWNLAMAVVVCVSMGAFEQARFAAGGVLLLAISVSESSPPMGPEIPAIGLLLYRTVLLAGVTVLARSLTQARRRAGAERARMEVMAESSSAEVARLAVAHERERLLVDVHAVLGAAVTSMLAHADSAGKAATAEAATGHLKEVQQAGREAMTELRTLLGQLRARPEDFTHSTSPREHGAQTSRSRADLGLWGATVAIVVLALVEVWVWRTINIYPSPSEPTLTASIVTATAAATIALHRSHPLLGAVALGVLLAVCGLLDAPVVAYGFAIAGVGLALTWSALARPGMRPIASVAVLLGGIFLYLTPKSEQLFFILGLMAVTAAVSTATAHHRSTAVSSAAQAARLDRDRRAASAEAVRAQRLAVARDLHDVVSHAVVVMTLQAGAAETLLPDNPTAARAAIDRLRAVGSATMAELDDLFAALRAMDETGHGDPVSHDITVLIARMQAGGLSVDLQARPSPDPPSDPLVYRVVQESLTNSLRHAPRSTVHVTITSSEQDNTVEVVDDGPGPSSAGVVRGYGLAGITERVEHAGGRVETGAAPDGRGFRVRARIPTFRTQVSK